MAKLRRIAGIGLTAIFIGLLAGIAVLSLPFSGLRALSVQTGSMQPEIDPGALVVTRRVEPSALRAGDVITYTNPQNEKSTITHRIQQITPLGNGRNQFIVKGDANPVADAPVQENQIIGRVSWSAPYLGKAIDFVRSPLGLLLMIYIPALMIGWSEIRLLVQRLTRLELAKRGIGATSALTTAMSGVGSIPGRMPPLSVVHKQYEQMLSTHRFSAKAKPGPKAPLYAWFAGAAVVVGIAAPTLAALTSNPVSLTATSIRTAGRTSPENPAPGSGDTTTVENTTNITIVNNNSQSAATGNVEVSGNTTAGNASSGSASNQSTSSVQAQVQN